ncbi:hypothetical protein LIA77_06977 [Sarocladium implicatum]|nr:hypothetical protein LIA77_06977 [Sarocladium implicatum]
MLPCPDVTERRKHSRHMFRLIHFPSARSLRCLTHRGRSTRRTHQSTVASFGMITLVVDLTGEWTWAARKLKSHASLPSHRDTVCGSVDDACIVIRAQGLCIQRKPSLSSPV